jgi:hypothetical protein
VFGAPAGDDIITLYSHMEANPTAAVHDPPAGATSA